MQYGIVDGCADVMCERAGAEIGGIVHVAGFGAFTVDNLLVHEFVDLQQVGTDFGGFLEFLEDSRNETTCGLHRLDFGGCFDFDHGL